MMTTTFFKKGEYVYYVSFNIDKVFKVKILDIEELERVTIITTDNERYRGFQHLTEALKANIAKNLPYVTTTGDAFFAMDKQTVYKLVRERYMQQYQQERFREAYKELLIMLKKL